MTKLFHLLAYLLFGVLISWAILTVIMAATSLGGMLAATLSTVIPPVFVGPVIFTTAAGLWFGFLFWWFTE